MPLPQQNQAYTFTFSLVSSADPTLFVQSHTFEAGDAKVSKNGGTTFTNLTTLPTMVNSISSSTGTSMLGCYGDGSSKYICLGARSAADIPYIESCTFGLGMSSYGQFYIKALDVGVDSRQPGLARAIGPQGNQGWQGNQGYGYQGAQGADGG